MREFGFQVLARSGNARRGVLETAHGQVRTPAFMPVGTGGSIKTLLPESVRAAGSDIVLANRYHLMLRPGIERIAEQGGIQKFMHWDGPVLTDSGGYQIMSLSALRRIDEDGVVFRSHLDGTEHRLTPENTVDAQARIGADIQMVLDSCVAHPASKTDARAAVELSLRWAERAKRRFAESPCGALFGIVQGATFPDLRQHSAEATVALGFDGYAMGGLALGEGQAATMEMLEATLPHLPETAPRYLMGVGRPEDLIAAVARGVDMFDCVLPTREGRHGRAYLDEGRINLVNAQFADDTAPLDAESACPASHGFSRAFIHHLVRSGEPLGAMLLSWHNIHYFQSLMERMRTSISEGDFANFTLS